MESKTAPVERLPEPFNFYRLVLDGDHLHFGYWSEDGAAQTLEEAQESMFKRLLAYFPKPPAAVLDVGCGLGFSAYLLSQLGYQITAIAPSEGLIDYARKHYQTENIDFFVTGFLDKNDGIFQRQHFDVVFFQESLQYLNPLKEVFQKASNLLKLDGKIIIGDEVCYDISIKKQTAVHLYKDIIVQLFEDGFRITQDLAIGNNVKPTCDAVISRFTESFDRIVSTTHKDDTAETLQFFLNGWKLQKRCYGNGSMGYGVFVAKKDTVLIRGYQEGDEHRILESFSNIFHEQRTLAHWYWKFRDNPFGSYKIAEATEENNHLIAHYSGYPVPFYCLQADLKESTIFHIGDTMTDPKARNLGLGKTSVLSRTTNYFYNRFCKDSVSFLYGFNTGNIRKFGERFLQYSYMPQIPYLTLDLKEKGSLIKYNSLKELFSGFSIEQYSDPPAEFDDFFDTVAKDYRALVLRKIQYLRWRYWKCPDKTYDIFAVKRFGKLIGWSVFTMKDETTVMWVDALFDRKYVGYVDLMLNHLLLHDYRDKCSVEGWFSPNPPWWTTALRKLGFRIQDEPHKLAPALNSFDNRLTTETLTRDFYYTLGDSDLI